MILEGILAILLLILALYFTTKKRKEPFPHRIFQTWKNKTPPPNMSYWQQTWRTNHPTWLFDMWDDEENRNFIQRHYPWFLPTYDSYDKEIKRADAIRYFYLYHHGGVYVDMDFESLKSLEPLLQEYEDYDILFGTIHTDGRAKQHTLPNAIMISKPKCNFWLSVFEALQQKAKQSSLSVEAMTGPVLLKEVYNAYWFGQTRIKLLEPHLLYPISWITNQQGRQDALHESSYTDLTKKMKRMYPRSYAITYWTHSW